jgi:hypothetical protein
MTDPEPVDRERALQARRRRNVALGLALIGFVVLVFIVTIVRLGANAGPHP